MAIGRVPGAALLGNLDRQGLDLGFTTNSVTLLQLDFTNYRLGINNATPQQALDVTGNILVTTGNVLTSANLSYNIGSTNNQWKNIYVGNIYVGDITSTNIAGTLTTAAQTNITSLGTLTSLGVSGNVTTGNVSGTYLSGTVITASQPNITTLAGVTSIGASGSTTLTGTLQTVSQPNITTLAGVTSIGASGSTTLTGTLQTNAQPNITSVGTLTSLAVTGNVSGANVIGTSLYGTLITAAQTNVTSLGTLSALTVSGNIIAQSSVVPTSNIAGNIGYADKWWSTIYANTINATGFNGTILTANQPNITTLGNITLGNITTGNISANVIHANLLYENTHRVVNETTPIIVTGDATATGNVANISLTLVNTGVVAGVYGSADDEYADKVPKITVDSKGRVTNIANVSLTQVGNVTFTDTTISTTSSITLNSANNGNIILNANGTGVVQISGDDAVGIPAGNTAARPTNVHTGYIRYNTDLGTIEYYNGIAWLNNSTGAFTSQSIIPTGLTNEYTLINDATTDSVLVSINGTLQQPTYAYTVSGNVIAFTETPLTSDIIEIRAVPLTAYSVTAITDGDIKVQVTELTGNITAVGNLNLTGNLIPSANVTYDLGDTNHWWRELYISGGSIHMGGSRLSVIDDTLTFFPAGSPTPITFGSSSYSNVDVSAYLPGYTGSISTVTTANTAMKGYVDNEITTVSNSVTGANAAIVTANTAMKGYVDNGNTIQSNQITSLSNSLAGANAAVSTSSNPQFNSLGIGTAGSATAGEIRATNNITAYYSSDARLKENVRDIPTALDKVSAIGGKLFDWTDAYIQSHGGLDTYFLRKEDFGVIAQDVKQVFPEAVRTRDDGYLAVDYEKLCALAFAAINELQQRVIELEQQIKDK